MEAEQVITNQIKQDEKVRSLVAMIETTYHFVIESQPVDKVKSQAYILEQISLQTFECVRFVVRYADDSPFCKFGALI